jgi:Tol biopolymer transport system component
MRRVRILLYWTLVLAVAVAVCAGPGGAMAAPGDTTIVSVSSSGSAGDSTSDFPAISADGRFVAFVSESSNFVTGDSNGTADVFVRDRTSGTTTRVSVSSTGGQSNGTSLYPSISGDGRFVAFMSGASNLVAMDMGQSAQIFVHDRTTGETTLVSMSASGVLGDGYCSAPSISADGRYVAYGSTSSTLIDGEEGGGWQVFIHDRTTKTVKCVSQSLSGQPGDGASLRGAVSSDGRFVTFSSLASDLVTGDTNGVEDVFIRDMVAGVTTRVSVDSAGAQGNGGSMYPSVSASGRYVAFESTATNLISGDTNGKLDVFMHDRDTGATTRVGEDSPDLGEDPDFAGPSISGDGRYVAFTSFRSPVAGEVYRDMDAFVYDRDTGKRVCVSAYSMECPSGSDNPRISSDGRFVAFNSIDDLVEGSSNSWDDVFVNEVSFDRTPSFVDLSTGSAPLLPYRGTFVVSGTLQSGGVGIVGEQVVLQSGVEGVFADTSLKATTGAGGAFSISVKPAVLMLYRVRFAGSAAYAPALSSTVYALPCSYVGTPVAPAKMSRTKNATVYGYLKPHHLAGTYPVRIYKERLVGRVWKSYGFVKAKASTYAGYTKYSASIRLPIAGKWRVRAFALGDAEHAAAYSGYDAVRVK